MPPLMPENHIIMKIFNIVKHQFIMSFSGIVSLNILSVIETVKLIDIPVKNRLRIVELVMKVGQIYIQLINEKSEGNKDG